jgi:hypothetical protein
MKILRFLFGLINRYPKSYLGEKKKNLPGLSTEHPTRGGRNSGSTGSMSKSVSSTSDQAGMRRKSLMDALGRVVQVAWPM